jgi:probable F420-dependent oxidoreductase
MLALARARSRGAIPYFVPVEHTRMARQALGPEPVLAVQMAFSVGHGAVRARELAHEYAAPYLPLPNYRNNLLRCGFGEADLAGAGSERLIDALVAIGDVDDVVARVKDHLDAGADHVCIDTADRTAEIPLGQLQAIAAQLTATHVNTTQEARP